MARQWLKILGLAVAFQLIGTGFVAGQEKDRFEGELREIAENIFVYQRFPSWRYWVSPNITFIINDSDIVVVDGGFPQYVENAIQEIKKITDKPISTVILTHWHQDHIWGNHVYREHFPGVRFVSQENMRPALFHRSLTQRVKTQEDYDELRKGAKDYWEKTLKEAEENEQDPEIISWMQDSLEGVDEAHDGIRVATEILADETFKDRLVLHRGDRVIEILHLGRANTDGDALVWLPRERIIITGDIVVHPTPYGFGSYPLEWAEVLKRIKALDFELLVPGHGNLQMNSDYLDNLIGLLEDLSEQTEQAVAEGAGNQEEAQIKVDLSANDEKFTRDDPLLLYLFQQWFKTPIMESAYKEAIGEEITQFDPPEENSVRNEEE